METQRAMRSRTRFLRETGAARRLIVFVALGAMILAACGADEAEPEAPAAQPDPPAAPEPAEEPEEPSFDTDSLTMIMHPTPFERIGGAEPDGLLALFEQETGIRVDVITAVSEEQVSRMQLEFAAQSDALDVVLLLGPQTDPRFMTHFLDLTPYIEQSATIEWEDILGGVRSMAEFDGEIKYAPHSFGLEYLYYLRSAYDEAGVEVPTTPEELDAVVRATATSDRFGIVLRGQGHELVQDFWTVAGLFGATELDNQGRCAANSPGAVAAVELLKSWLDDGVLPTDFFAWGRDDLVAAVQTGRTANVLAFHLRYPAFVGADATIDSDDLGWARPPGDIIRDPTAGGGYAIPQYSSHPDAAWALIEFILSPENSDMAISNWGQSVFRESHITSERLEELPPLTDWMRDAQDTESVLIHENASQMNDILNDWLTQAIQGTTPIQQAMDRACEQIDPLL